MIRSLQGVATILVLLATTAVFFADLSSAQACAACACGDPTLTTLGNDRAFAGRIRMSSIMHYRTLKLGDAANQTELRELQLMLAGAASLTDRLTLGIAMPLAELTVNYANLAQDRSVGPRDPRLSAKWTVMSDRTAREAHLGGVRFELRLPTAPEFSANDGTLLPIEAQLDTGSWKFVPALWYSYFAYPWSLQASARLRVTTEGNQAYQQGIAGFVDVQGQYQLNTRLALSAGLHGRIARENTQADSPEPDTGGGIVFGSAGLTVALAQDTSLNLNGFIPAYAVLNGYQKESPLVEVSLTTDF